MEYTISDIHKIGGKLRTRVCGYFGLVSQLPCGKARQHSHQNIFKNLGPTFRQHAPSEPSDSHSRRAGGKDPQKSTPTSGPLCSFCQQSPAQVSALRTRQYEAFTSARLCSSLLSFAYGQQGGMIWDAFRKPVPGLRDIRTSSYTRSLRHMDGPTDPCWYSPSCSLRVTGYLRDPELSKSTSRSGAHPEILIDETCDLDCLLQEFNTSILGLPKELKLGTSRGFKAVLCFVGGFRGSTMRIHLPVT